MCTDREWQITMKVTFKKVNDSKFGCLIDTTPSLHSPYIAISNTPDSALAKSNREFLGARE